MYPVTEDFQNKISASERQVFGRVVIDYTSPFLDESIEVAASEQANISFPVQTADAVPEPFAKIASLDGSWELDGTYALAPATAEEADQKQMGWWGKQLAGAGGVFVSPYPTLTVTFFSRPITRLQVIGDSKRQEYPVDFTIRLYDAADLLLHTETVTGNAGVTWSKTLEAAVTQVAKMELEITRWSHAGRQAKILEFFTSIQETYEGDDILLIHLLEEREVSQGSLPVGNISANEIDIQLNNEHRKFDAGNEQSPLYGSLKANRRIRAWLGVETTEGKEYVPLGIFWSGDWNVPEDGVHAQTTGRDRLELLRKSTYSVSKVLPEAKELPSPTFTRASEAYLSDGTKVAANQPRFEAGKFGKAVLIEEGATNLLINSDGCPDVLLGEGTTPPSVVAVTDVNNPFGNKAWKVTFVAGSNTGFAGCRVKTNLWQMNKDGSPYSVSIWIKGDTTKLYIYPTGNSGLARMIATGKTIGDWKEYACVENKLTGGGTASEYITIYLTESTATDIVIYVGAAQAENKAYVTSFTSGTRAAETLTIPTAGVLSPQEGTVELWLPSGRRMYGGDPQFILDIGGTGYSGAFLQISPSGHLSFALGNGVEVLSIYSNAPLEPTQAYYVAAKWWPGYFTLAVNGETISKAFDHNFIPYDNLIIGSNIGTQRWLTGLVDDLRISSHARSDEEILQAYASGKPAVWDEDTTYILRFDGDMQTAQQTATLHGLAKNILTDAELTTEEYWLDPELKLFPVPYAYFEPQSHREALRKIAEACLGQVYCDRDGILRIEGPSYLAGQAESELILTGDDYFRKDNPVKWSEIANYVEVETQPLRPDVLQEVYRSNEPLSIAAGQTRTITTFYNEPPCIEAVASLEEAPAGCTIESATYYAWGADVKVTSTETGTFTLVIEARPLKVLNKEKAIAKDDESILDNGLLKYTFPANPLIQTLEVAQTIAEKLLASAKLARRDLEMEWRGNPALLLGDRVTVTDKNEQNDYFVTRQELEFDGALRARLSGRRA